MISNMGCVNQPLESLPFSPSYPVLSWGCGPLVPKVEGLGSVNITDGSYNTVVEMIDCQIFLIVECKIKTNVFVNFIKYNTEAFRVIDKLLLFSIY